MKKSVNEHFTNLFNNISSERQAQIDADIDAHIKWMDEHPDFNERYGTDKSYWLDEIRAKGFNPIGITTMTCEETIILATKEEVEKAWEIFRPEGWWYSIEQWKETREWYVNEMYEGDHNKAPKVYCLDEKYSEILGYLNTI